MEAQTLSSPTGTAAGKRVALTLPACAGGWMTAMLVTLPFEWLELIRNAAPHALGLAIFEGTLLWLVFTCGVCAVLWCVVVLPMGLLAPSAWVLRWRGLLAIGFPLLAVLLIGWRLEVWRDLVWETGGESPFKNRLLWEYWLFGATLALVTTLIYAHLLRRRA